MEDSELTEKALLTETTVKVMLPSQAFMDPYERSVRYLEGHNILQIFQEITANLVLSRPDDPLQFILEQVQKKIRSRDESNIKAEEAE